MTTNDRTIVDSGLHLVAWTQWSDGHREVGPPVDIPNPGGDWWMRTPEAERAEVAARTRHVDALLAVLEDRIGHAAVFALSDAVSNLHAVIRAEAATAMISTALQVAQVGPSVIILDPEVAAAAEACPDIAGTAPMRLVARYRGRRLVGAGAALFAAGIAAGRAGRWVRR